MKQFLILIIFITTAISVNAQQKVSNDVFRMELPAGSEQASEQARQQKDIIGAKGNIYSKNNLVLSYRVNEEIKVVYHSLEIKQKQQTYLYGKMKNTVVTGSKIVTYGNVRFLLLQTRDSEGDCITFTSEHNGRYAYIYGHLKFAATDSVEANAYLSSILGSFRYN